MSEREWPSEWLRGVLELVVLRVLADGASYGYAIAGRLTDGGFGVIKGGTLYPLLTRLEASGDVTTHWSAGEGGPGRKYFELSVSGRRRLAETSDQWRRFAGVVTDFIDTSSGKEI